MRVYISADMEGVNGVVLKEHVDPEKKEYALAREWMIQEVNAAVAGAVAGGAEEVVVNDSHNICNNLPIDRLHPRARLCCGAMKPYSMMQEIDNSYHCAFLIGYHARYGTANAVLDHIFAYSMFTRVEVNGVAVGEFGLNAGLAAHYGVPATLVTGDQAVVAEARALIPNITFVMVKEGRSRNSAFCYPFHETCTAIEQAAKQAVRNAKKIKPLLFKPPLQLTVTYQRVESADLAALLPESVRLDNQTIRCQAANYPELYRKFLALFRLARA